MSDLLLSGFALVLEPRRTRKMATAINSKRGKSWKKTSKTNYSTHRKAPTKRQVRLTFIN